MAQPLTTQRRCVVFRAVTAPPSTDVRHALLARLIDHAALFPPASMSVEDALTEEGRLRASLEGWIVGRFVVPASRVGELGDAPLRLTVVLDSAPPEDARIESVEARPGADLDSLIGLAPEVYAEVRLDAAGNGLGSQLERLSELGLRAKFRCGPAVPPAASLAAAIARCRGLGLPFKATAGLHHALPTGGEHGFLNLLAAVVFGDEEEALGARDLRVTAAGFGWGTRIASPEKVRAARELFVGFDSCGVAEPISELRALGVLA
jgi:hypothetical protein